MEIYIVKGSATKTGYLESVVIMQNMEEKPKSFIGNGKKIAKDKINKLEEGTMYGSFKVALLNPEKIEESRIIVKERVLEYNLSQLKKYQQIVNNIEQHDLNTSIKQHIYEK